MRISKFAAVILVLGAAGCATSSIQPMAKDTFKVATNAAPACGPNGARNVAFKTASIEVIRRGGDKFIVTGDNSESDFWSGDHQQGMVIKMIPEGSAEARNALSAREQLGPEWQTMLSKGAPTTCS
jgi:hypothetical protein